MLLAHVVASVVVGQFPETCKLSNQMSWGGATFVVVAEGFLVSLSDSDSTARHFALEVVLVFDAFRSSLVSNDQYCSVAGAERLWGIMGSVPRVLGPGGKSPKKKDSPLRNYKEEDVDVPELGVGMEPLPLWPVGG